MRCGGEEWVRKREGSRQKTHDEQLRLERRVVVQLAQQGAGVAEGIRAPAAEYPWVSGH